MANRNQRDLLWIENGMADIARADIALTSIRARIRSLCYKPAITLTDIDALYRDLAVVEIGLAIGRRMSQAEREGEG